MKKFELLENVLKLVVDILKGIKTEDYSIGNIEAIFACLSMLNSLKAIPEEEKKEEKK